MKRNQLSNFVASHMRAPFGLPGGYSRLNDKPDEPEFQPYSEGGWNHDTVVEGDNLVDLDGNDITGQFDKTGFEELDEEEEESEDDPKKKDDEEEEEPEEEEETDKEEEEEVEEKEDKKDDKEEEGEEVAEVEGEDLAVQLTPSFARLKRAEAFYVGAAKQAKGEVTGATVAKELVEKRNGLLRERSKLDPLSGDEAADRLADIDIEVAELNTTIGARINQAEAERRDSVNEAKKAASDGVNETLALIGKVYPQLDESSKLYRADLADTFNALQEQYTKSMSVTEAMQKALETVVKMSGMTSKVAPAKGKEKDAKEAVQRRVKAKAKQPVRKDKKPTGADGSLRSYLGKDMSDPKVKKAMKDMLGISFDE